MTDNPDPLADGDENKQKPKLWEGVNFAISNVGMIVFAISALSIIIFMFVFNLFVGESSDDNYVAFRSIELILTISGLSLIISFLSKTKSELAVIFGFFIVSALVVPTKDIVRLALLATGSERTVEHYYSTGSTVTNIVDTDSGSAARIVQLVLKNVPNNAWDNQEQNITEEQRDAIVAVVQEVLQGDNILSMVEKVKARGAFETLQAVGSGESRLADGSKPTEASKSFQQYSYRYADNEKFYEDLKFLRSEDLISLTFDDLNSVVLTAFGEKVLEREVGISEELNVASSGPGAQGVCADAGASASDFLGDRIENFEDIALGVEERFRKFTIAGNSVTGKFNIKLESSGSADSEGQRVDPLLTVYEAVSPNCYLLVEDDDSGGDLNSKVEIDLRAGTYVIGVRSIGGYGPAKLTVSKDTSDTGQADSTDTNSESAEPADSSEPATSETIEPVT